MLIFEHVNFWPQFQGFQYTSQTLCQTTFFICHNLAIWLFNKLYFLIFRRSLLHTLVSPGIATSIIVVSFFTLSTIKMSGLLGSVMWSHYILKFHAILKFSFSPTLSGLCSCQIVALLNQYYLLTKLPMSGVDKSNSQWYTFTYSFFTLFCSVTYFYIKIIVRVD